MGLSVDILGHFWLLPRWGKSIPCTRSPNTPSPSCFYPPKSVPLSLTAYTAYIENLFGKHVAAIVVGCTEPNRSLDWADRKQHTIDYLKTAPPEIRAVSCADKLHNVRCMTTDYEEIGEHLWNRFNAGKDGQEWYYKGLVGSLCDRLEQHPDNSIFHQFKMAVSRLFDSSN